MTDKIIKIDNISLKDMKDFEGWEKCINIVPGYKHIIYSQMYKAFGISNFVDDYKESNWWILNFDNTKFAVEINSREGCWLHIYIPEEFFYYSNNTKQKVKNFYEQLYKQI